MIKDKHFTVVVQDTFIGMLNDLKEARQKASLLINTQGLDQESGLVTRVDSGKIDRAVHLSTGRIIPLDAIIAVNGIFLSVYC